MHFILLSLLSVSLAWADPTPEQGCRFQAMSRLKLTSMGGAIQAEEQAMVEAREEALKKCAAAGWSQCGDYQYSATTREYFSTLDQFQVQYEVSVTSTDCINRVREDFSRSVREKETAWNGENYVLSEVGREHLKPVTPVWKPFGHKGIRSPLDTCQPGALEPASPGEIEGSTEIKKGTETRNNAIPGDCNGTGKRH